MSEKLTIYADFLSEPSRSVVVFCKLSGIEFEFHSIDLAKGEYESEEYKQINPDQKVPALTHGNYKLNESGAIIAYLADTFNIDNQWYPKDPKSRGRINAFIHWHHQGIREIKDDYLMPKIILPLILNTPPPTPEAEAVLREKVMEMLKSFEWVLSHTKYAAMTTGPTIADIFAYNELEMLKLVKISFEGFPLITAWLEEIGKTPHVQESLEKFNGFLTSLP